MGLSGRGALVGWFDCDSRDEPAVSEWLAREHFPERIGVPGFLRGRRFRSREGHPEFFVLYELDAVSTLSSEVYLERLNNPTRLTRKIAPRISGTRRTACSITAGAGDTDGGTIGTLDVRPGPNAADLLRSRLATRVLPDLAVRPGVFSAHLLEPDYGISTIQTVEKALRAVPDEMTNWIVLVEGQNEEAIRRAAADLLTPDALTAHGAAAVQEVNAFELEFALSRRDS